MLTVRENRWGRLTLSAIVGSISLTLIQSPVAQASSTANTTANATATVVSSISITRTQHLQFGQAAPSDSAATISPVTQTASAAAFTVSGQASTAYTITLPSDGTVTMTTGAGDTADKQIAVSSFTSSPSTSGTLDGSGNQTLYVGATRAAIRATQTAGSYSGSFTVTVTYQ